MTVLSNSRDCPNCGSAHKSKPFCTYENGYHCFSCGVTKRGDRSFSETPKTAIKLPEISGELITKYENFSLISKAWLMKYYIDTTHVKKYNIFEVREYNKVWLVFPVISDQSVLFYQKRCMNERGFISSGQKKSVKCVLNSDSVVIVEDFISYCRVSQFTDCICLFGTKLNEEDTRFITTNYDGIKIWLDNDSTKNENSGQIAAKKICKQLKYALYLKQVNRGFTVRDSRISNIVTRNDPKCYSDTEIKQILGADHDFQLAE